MATLSRKAGFRIGFNILSRIMIRFKMLTLI